MHDLALLKRLTNTQLEFVIRNDPLGRSDRPWARELVPMMTSMITDQNLINEFLLSWAKELEANNRHGIASDYYRVYDERTESTEKRSHAIRVGSFNSLMECGDCVEWFHIAQTGHRALAQKKTEQAYQCFKFLHTNALERFQEIETELSEIPESRSWTHRTAKAIAKSTMKSAQKGLKKILRYALCNTQTDLVQKCLTLLDRKLTQPEIRELRHSLVTLFKEDMLDSADEKFLFSFLAEHGSDSEKRACLNCIASRGDTKDLEDASVMWNIPLTERHWRIALQKYWIDEPNGGSATQRVYIAAQLIKYSPRYASMLLQARIGAREEAIGFGEVELASEIGNEIGKPLTLDELTHFMRKFGRDERCQEIQVPFAVAQMIKLIGPTE